jgi:hypothetical protein
VIVGRLFGADVPISRQSARLLALTSPASHAQAPREMGWPPAPTEDAIRRAAENYVSGAAQG